MVLGFDSVSHKYLLVMWRRRMRTALIRRGGWIDTNHDHQEICPGGGMVDTLVLEASAERRGSSSLPWGTTITRLD